MNIQSDRSEVRPGEFPFPLTGGPNESRFLTWLRNHSKYMAVSGLVDYLRMAAVLVRGILLNNLVILPRLLVIALAISIGYSSLLTNWEAQEPGAAPAMTVLRANHAVRAAHHAEKAARDATAHDHSAAAARELQAAEAALERARAEFCHVRDELLSFDWGKIRPAFFLTRPIELDDGSLMKRIQDLEWGLTTPFLLTPVVLALAAGWILLFPVLLKLSQIAGYQQSLATGSDSSVKLRDWYERSFSYTLLAVIAVALFESLPLLVYFYHRARLMHLDGAMHEKEFFALVTLLLSALSGAPKFLGLLGGAVKKVAMAVIACVGLLIPLMVVVLVADFVIFEPMPHQKYWWPLITTLLVVPVLYVAGIAIAIGIGIWRRTFTGAEYLRLVKIGGLVIGAHVILIGLIYLLHHHLFFWLYEEGSRFAFDIFLAVPGERGDTVATYGDLAFYFVAGCAAEIWFFCWLTVDINQTSIHGLYRDRLASAYLLGVNARGQVDIEEDVDLAELCCHAAGSTAPYHLLNVALNLQGSKDISLRDRQSDFFIFSKKFIGSARTGYCRSTTMEQVFPQIDLACAMATSAAAASPNSGRETSPALVAFMTLINMRLGVWIPNPGLLEETVGGRKPRMGGAAGQDEPKPGFTFEEVFRDELASIESRWAQLGPKAASRRLATRRIPTPDHGLAGIAFSGGGIRSATINLGIAQVLHKNGIFDHFDYMSTVSGGGYLGSSISTLMRFKTSPVSTIAGTVSLKTGDHGQKVVTVTPLPPDEPCSYAFSKEAVLEVRDGDAVKPGTRLIRRPGTRLRSELAGTVRLDLAPADGVRTLHIDGAGPGETRAYPLTRFDELAVQAGDIVKAGDSLIRTHDSFFDRFSWRVRPTALLDEMTMRLDESRRWVNLSDGGHIENLATIELLRRRCKLIVIGDGEADPNLHFNGLATLMRTARIDLGIEIDLNLDELRLDARRCSKAHLALGRVTYPPGPGEGDEEYGYLLYLKSSYTGDEDEVIGEYRRRNPEFPHESTADQFFDEGQFEAYRAQGQHIGEKAIAALGYDPVPASGQDSFAQLVACFEAYWKLEQGNRARRAAAG